MSIGFFNRCGWRRAVERKRWPERASQDGELWVMKGVVEKEATSGGEGLKGCRRREGWKREVVRNRWDLNLRASLDAIRILLEK